MVVPERSAAARLLTRGSPDREQSSADWRRVRHAPVLGCIAKVRVAPRSPFDLRMPEIDGFAGVLEVVKRVKDYWPSLNVGSPIEQQAACQLS